MSRPIHKPNSNIEVLNAAEVQLIAGGVAFLRPTRVGLYDKRLLDAVANVREYFRAARFHDYSEQEQGVKVLKPAILIRTGTKHSAVVSLYRPPTKSGDPRMWVAKLADIAAPGELLGFVVIDDQLAVLNLSKAEVRDFRVLADLMSGAPDIEGVLAKVRSIADSGWIPSVAPGDTGVGMTVEAALKILPNSSPGPDLNGVEIKSSRIAPRRPMQLFSKAPNWSLGGVCAKEKGAGLVARFGWNDKRGHRHLVHDVSCKSFNSKRLKLRLGDRLLSLHHSSQVEALCSWEVSTLRESLRTKHNATVWIDAEPRLTIGGSEEFRLTRAVVTRQPRDQLFSELLSEDGIFVALLLGRAKGGDTYSFKLRKQAADALFPEPIVVDFR